MAAFCSLLHRRREGRVRLLRGDRVWSLEAPGLLDARRVLLAPLHFYQSPSSTWVIHFLKLPAKKSPVHPHPLPTRFASSRWMSFSKAAGTGWLAWFWQSCSCRQTHKTCLLVAQARYQNRVASAKIRDYLREQLPQQEMIWIVGRFSNWLSLIICSSWLNHAQLKWFSNCNDNLPDWARTFVLTHRSCLWLLCCAEKSIASDL